MDSSWSFNTAPCAASLFISVFLFIPRITLAISRPFPFGILLPSLNIRVIRWATCVSFDEADVCSSQNVCCLGCPYQCSVDLFIFDLNCSHKILVVTCFFLPDPCSTAVWVSLTCHNSYIVPPPLPILRLRLRLICYYGITKPFFSLPFPLLSPRLPFAHLLSPLQLIRTDLNIVLFVSHSHGADVSLSVCLWLYLGFEFLLSVHHLNSSLHIMLVRMYCGRDVVGSLDGVRGRPVGLDVFQ